MSRLRANQITNKTANGAPTATNGLDSNWSLYCNRVLVEVEQDLTGVAATDNINTSTMAVLTGTVTVVLTFK